jgi:predicted branched-subunit amino acid permease
MNTKTKDGTSARNDTPSVRMSIVPEFSATFWTNWLLAAMAGEIAGHALNHIYLHRSGRLIVALTLCFVATGRRPGARSMAAQTLCCNRWWPWPSSRPG